MWSTTARVVVTEPAALARATGIVRDVLDAVDRAASRFRADSELRRLVPGVPTTVSPVCAQLVRVALIAAERTGGAVDPTMGRALGDLGYDRDLSLVDVDGLAIPLVVRQAPGWRSVRLTGRRLTVPEGVELDLGATAKAHAADVAAQLVAAVLDTGVLVSLGGDIATAGPAPEGGWRVLVRDQPDDPSCVLTMPAGRAIATSSTRSRGWRRGRAQLHHILDPRTCLPAKPVWRSVSAVAESCVDANTATTAALVHGVDGPRRMRLAARFVALDKTVVTVAGWPR
ncbi:FAD:protein FMN transferase [Labedaea rhizosphaerae]|uniref:FAD:protein FMN transferase n=1 Tax=Labedaea rhizosphaerae TaxID=598644 RepID=UPI001FB5D5C5|nr:FAD:protein FMN transferase [Labedaea rhizosphaerae]